MTNESVKTISRFMILVIVMVTLVYPVFAVSAFAEDVLEPSAAEAASGAAQSEAYAENVGSFGSVTFADESRLEDVRQIRVPFPNVSDERIEWDFPYSDDFFRLPSAEFSMTMARGSMGLTVSAFRSDAGAVPLQYETYLLGAGFTHIRGFGYDSPPREDSLSGVFGMKRIDDCTIIAAAACGQGYGNEWASNFKVGSNERHSGFAQAAALFEEQLAQYLKDTGIEGRKKLWISGFSRASAVGNILAADMIAGGAYDDVYAYLFGVPRTTGQPVPYAGIYNICGQYDPVPSVPLQSWGYERYGTDLYTPAQESDADFTRFALSAKEIGLRLDGKGFRNNPEVNYQLRLILESLGEFFPDRDDYVRQLQDLLADAVINHSEDHVLELLTTAFENFNPEKSQDRAKTETFVNYLGYIVGQHLRAEQRQVDDGSWDPEETLAANLALEHLPSTYIRWLFSEDDPQKIFCGSVTSRRLSMIGPVGITVLKDGCEISRIDINGKVSYPLEQNSDGSSRDPGVFIMRNENITVISLPNDAEYYVRIDAPMRCTVTFYDLIISPERLATEAGKITLGAVSEGSYGFHIVPDAEIPLSPDEIAGNYTRLGSSDYDYSPIAVMNDELEATKIYFMSMKRVYGLAIRVVVGFILFLTGCLFMHLIHRHLEKRGHPPFSKWYIIIPHLITIVGLMILTAIFTYHLFVIDKVRVVCGSFTMLSIFLLALRGTLRYRRKSSILLTSTLFFLFSITFLFLNRTEKLTFSWVSMTVFAIAVGLLTAAAVRTFREPSEEPRNSDLQSRSSL